MLNFSITELCKSDVAKRNNINNFPQQLNIYDNLLNLIYYVLQPIRDKFGEIIISSGFRNIEVNKLVGGVSTSNHLKGYAADIIPKKATFKQVYDFITKNLDYDECFIESNKQGKKWLHVAYRKKSNRKKHNASYLV